MSASNGFIPFAYGTDANVLSDDAYSSALSTNGLYVDGVIQGKASSKQANKTWRQSTVMAAVLGEIIVEIGQNANDGQKIELLKKNLIAAIRRSSLVLPFDGDFAMTISGYPAKAIVADPTALGVYWVSTSDNNLTIPGEVDAQWQKLLAPVEDGLAAEIQRAKAAESDKISGSESAVIIENSETSDKLGRAMHLNGGSKKAWFGYDGGGADLAWSSDVTNEINRAQKAEGDLISGTDSAILPDVDKKGLALHLNGGSGRPWFGYDGGGNDLAWSEDVANERTRAGTAEASLQRGVNDRIKRSGDRMDGDLHIGAASLYTDRIFSETGMVRVVNRVGLENNLAVAGQLSLGNGTDDFTGKLDTGTNPIASWSKGWFYSGGGVYQYSDTDIPFYIGTGVDGGAIISFYTKGSGTSSIGSIICRGNSVQFSQTSDYRLKENISTLSDDGTDVISKLRPVMFSWKRGGRRQAGFIAHELAEVIPIAVSGVKDEVDDNGNIKSQLIDTSEIIPYLVAEVQSLRKSLDALQK